MGQVAVRAASAVGYTNAGTVEFLLDRDGSFYFLEMNTRLQVEHPITESITGLDIVKEQLRLAAGQPLGYGQEDIRLQGWALECRITAEDPANGFLPASGRVIRLFQPSGPGIRVDGGLYEGLEVSLYYDPLLAKLIAWAPSRDEAIQRMRRALREFRIVGLPTSIPFHQAVLEDGRFQSGEYNTAFLEDLPAPAGPERDEHRRWAAIVATLLSHQQAGRQPVSATSPEEGNGVDGWQPGKSWKLAGRWEAQQ
jgi:acetyl/propionyl-CoA carboxylase alpha subunit